MRWSGKCTVEVPNDLSDMRIVLIGQNFIDVTYMTVRYAVRQVWLLLLVVIKLAQIQCLACLDRGIIP